jgi:hypothetical protein
MLSAYPSLLDLISSIIFRSLFKRFPLLQSVQSGLGADPTSCSVDTAASYAEIKWPGRETDHSIPSSSEVNNWWS